MTVVRLTISGTAEGISEKIIDFATLLDIENGRDVKWETIDGEDLVVPSPVIEQGPFKSREIAIDVANRCGWSVSDDGDSAITPRGEAAALLTSCSVYVRNGLRWHWVVEEKS